MNRYGVLAMEYWKKWAPTRYQGLEDPEVFFTDLGEQIQSQVLAILEPMERTIPMETPYLEKVGTMNAMRNQAEEVVLAEMVYSVETEYSVAEELDQLLSELPAASSVEDSMSRLRERIEQDGGATEGEEAVLAQWSSLLPLISFPGNPWDAVESLSEAEKTDLVLKLRPFLDPETHALVKLPY